MILVTGGIASGKRTYARSLGFSDEQIAVVPTLAEGGVLPDVDELATHPIVISPEVGGGVVPIDPDERAWRERVGRLSCQLAERADTVVRMVCGVPVYLKGGRE